MWCTLKIGLQWLANNLELISASKESWATPAWDPPPGGRWCQLLEEKDRLRIILTICCSLGALFLYHRPGSQVEAALKEPGGWDQDLAGAAAFSSHFAPLPRSEWGWQTDVKFLLTTLETSVFLQYTFVEVYFMFNQVTRYQWRVHVFSLCVGLVATIPLQF